ncbi:MAG: T9SS C-terminal target domain-containing protein [Bacteroidetes bacterium]|nr:MAG: T9SS C-terminal target domain-containing protein [Bacteroidota bacterium]
MLWNPNPDGVSYVYVLLLSGTDLYVGGDFTSIGGQSRNSIARLSTTGTGVADATWNPNPDTQGISSLALSGTDLYVGGGFTSIGGQSRNNIAKLSTTGTGVADATWNPHPNGVVSTLVFSGTDLYMGGYFESIGGQVRNHIARIQKSNQELDLAWNPNANGEVGTLAILGTDLYVGGEFTSIGGQNRNYIAKLSTTGIGAADLTWNPNANNSVYSLAVSGTDLYVGGRFSNIGGLPRICIAKLSTSTGTANTVWNPNPNNVVLTLLVSGTDLYVGGRFTNIGGATRNSIAKLSTTDTGVADGIWNPGANYVEGGTNYLATIHALALSGTDLYVGGRFTNIGGQNRNYIAKLSTIGIGAVDITWNPDMEYSVFTLALSGTDLYVGGIFAAVGGLPRDYIAKLSTTGTGEADATWNPHLGYYILKLFILDANLYVSGHLYTSVGGQALTYLAVFAVPALTLSTSTLSGFSATPLAPSASQSYTISGINLTAIASLSLDTTDWEISTDNNNFSATLDLAQNGGTLTGQPMTVYVRLKSGLSLGNKTATLTANSAGAITKTIALSGVVDKATQTITFDTLPTKTFGDAPFALNASASSNLEISYSSSNTNVATISGNTVTIVGTGTTTITASQNGNENYLPATSVTQDLVVNKANQTITFNAIADKVYGNLPFQLNATSNSNLAVSYSISTLPATGVATLSGNTVTIIGLGSVSLTASQAGNTNYNPATEVVRTFQVLYPTSTQPSVAVGEVVAFPNPSKSGVFELRGLQSIDKQQVSYVVIDASGKQIASGIWVGKDVKTLNLSAFANGVYILDLRGSKKQITKKIVKQ